jgi:hypothetical protein
MKKREWTKDEETEALSKWGKDVRIRCFKADDVFVLIDKDNMFIFEDKDYEKCYKQIGLYKQ